MAVQPSTLLQIPCCLCGTPITPNAANQCSTCLASQFDLASILSRGPGGSHHIEVHQCRRCRRYEMAENAKRWEYADPESPELLRLCLKRIPALQQGSKGGAEQHLQQAGVSKIHLVDASWVWTEPHSMRLKVRLTVRAELAGGVNIQQRCAVELVVQWKQCPECNREFTNRTWHAVVQLRQKRSDGASRRGLVLLEAALAKNPDVRRHVLSVDPSRHGFDFYFLSLHHARLFASYIARIAPMRIKTTQKLVSTDVKSNTANLKHTVTCDVVPLCRDDLIIVDKRVSSGGGGGAGYLSGQLCLVDRMSTSVHLVNASPARSAPIDQCFADIYPDNYWRGEKHYRVLFSSTRLTKFVVLDVEVCDSSDSHSNWEEKGKQNGSGISKYALADVEVVRESDFGKTDETLRTVTHLGNLLQYGDTVLGYDLVSSVLPSDAEWAIENSFRNSFVMPDCVLVKKITGGGGADILDTSDKYDEEKGKKKPKAKSSSSKRRERREKRKENKAKSLEDHMARMGFGSDAGDDTEVDDAVLKKEREAFEKELEKDPELAQELEAANEILKESGVEMTKYDAEEAKKDNSSGEDGDEE